MTPIKLNKKSPCPLYMESKQIQGLFNQICEDAFNVLHICVIWNTLTTWSLCSLRFTEKKTLTNMSNWISQLSATAIPYRIIVQMTPIKLNKKSPCLLCMESKQIQCLFNQICEDAFNVLHICVIWNTLTTWSLCSLCFTEKKKKKLTNMSNWISQLSATAS